MAKTITVTAPTTAVELYNLANELNTMRQSAKKRAIVAMLEGVVCEHGCIAIENKLYHFNGEKLTRNYELSECYHCNLATDGECNDCASLETIEETEQVVEPRRVQSAWLTRLQVEAKELEAIREAEETTHESEKVTSIASELDVPASEVAAIAQIAAQMKEDKRMERATFAAETKLETVQEQERQVVRVERRSDFSMCGTSFFYYHPECYCLQGTTPIEINTLSHHEVSSKTTCIECGGSVHNAPEQVQRQEELQHQERQETMDTATTREEWLASLKSGDRAATHHHYAGYRLYTVERRTPSGRIIMANGTQFDKNGREIGGDKWNTEQLEEITPEVEADIMHRHLVSSVNSLVCRLNINSLKDLSDEALKEIRSVLNKYQIEDEV